MVSGCGQADAPKARSGDAAPQGQAILRAIYRDDRAILLLALPAAGTRIRPSGDCAQPLLIDPATGQATAIEEAVAAQRIKSMQLVGATNGTCPAASRR